MKLRITVIFTLISLFACGTDQSADKETVASIADLDSLAREYLFLELSMGWHDDAHVDAYFGPEEIRESREESIELLDSRGPSRCAINEQGELEGLATVGVVSIFDEQGRFAPQYDDSDARFHAADMVIEAIGQMTDVSIFGDALTERLEWNRGRLQVDENGCTSEPWLWSAGDMVKGPDVIHAVADGHRVAASIEEYFE